VASLIIRFMYVALVQRMAVAQFDAVRPRLIRLAAPDGRGVGAP
jgi:hypothetical protein